MMPRMEAIEIGMTQCLLNDSKLPTSEDTVTGGWSREFDDMLDDTAW